MALKDLSAAALDLMTKAARAGQTLMREAFGLDVRPTGHWGTYTQKKYNELDWQKRDQVKQSVRAYGVELDTLVAVAAEASAVSKKKAPAPAGSAESKRVFLEQVVPAVKARAAAMGFANPSLAVAQLAYESAHGASVSGKFNYGGIKATASEAGTVVSTKEGYGANTVRIRDKFKDYPSAEAFVEDYLAALVRKWPGTLRAKTGNEFAKALVADPARKYFTANPVVYASAINSISGRYA